MKKSSAHIHCQSGYYVYVCNFRYHECGQCIVKSGLLLEFFAKYVPLIMFLLAMILLDINLASGQMNTFSSLKCCSIWTSTLVDKFPYQMLPNHLQRYINFVMVHLTCRTVSQVCVHSNLIEPSPQ